MYIPRILSLTVYQELFTLNYNGHDTNEEDANDVYTVVIDDYGSFTFR